MSTQLTFRFDQRPIFTEASFCVGPSNEAAWNAVGRWPDWPGNMYALCGPRGSGKSHLAAIWAHRASAAYIRADEITEEKLSGLAGFSALVVDGSSQLDHDQGGFSCDERALFHFFNIAVENEIAVLFTSRLLLADWEVSLPDLVSRLKTVPTALLSEPDEETLGRVLVKLFGDLQLSVSEEVVAYLVIRMPRSYSAAQQVVAKIDEISLRDGGGISKAVAGAALRSLI